jgi:hypothetical protein
MKGASQAVRDAVSRESRGDGAPEEEDRTRLSKLDGVQPERSYPLTTNETRTTGHDRRREREK